MGEKITILGISFAISALALSSPLMLDPVERPPYQLVQERPQHLDRVQAYDGSLHSQIRKHPWQERHGDQP